jgi:hypothetical protein
MMPFAVKEKRMNSRRSTAAHPGRPPVAARSCSGLQLLQVFQILPQAVTGEPFSTADSCFQGKYREFSRFWALLALMLRPNRPY